MAKTPKSEPPKKPKKPKALPATGKRAAASEAGKQPFAELPDCLKPNRVGRPTKYHPSFCDLVLELGAQGKSRAQMAAAIGVDRDILTDWEKRQPEFHRSLKWAIDLALAWWEDVGQMNMTRAGFNHGAYIFQMCNRFRKDYQQRVTLSGNPEAPLVTKVERRVIHVPKP